MTRLAITLLVIAPTAAAYHSGFAARLLSPQLRTVPAQLFAGAPGGTSAKQRLPAKLKPAPSGKPTATPALSVEPTKKPFAGLTHMALPVFSYAGLAAVTAGSIHVVGAGVSWLSVGVVGSIALPAAFVAYVCTRGGADVAASMGGKPADRTLTALAQEAAQAVGVPPPEAVYEITASEPNAFAASNLFSRSQTVAVTSGLRSVLSTNELKAVLAHEMGHLKHSDVVRNMHVAIAVAGLGGVYDAGRMLLRSSSRSERSSKSDDKEGGGAGVGLMLMGAGLASQAVAQVVRLAASREAEIKADRAAAQAFGADAMINALRKIDQAAGRRPADLRESQAGRRFAFAMISDGESAEPAASKKKKSGGGAWRKVVNVLRTHPPVDERIAALEQATADGHVPASLSSSSWF